MPYYMESTTLVSNAPKEKNRAFAVFSPFRAEVWMCICSVTTVIGPLLYALSRLMVKYLGMEDRTQYSMQSLAFNMYRTLMVQGNLVRSPHWTLRFIFVFWYLFSFYIYAMYSATLTAVLAVPSFEKPIDSLEDLAQAHRDGYIIATTRDSSFAGAFQTAASGLFHEVWKLFNHKDPDKSFLPAPASGFDIILKRKCVFINAELNSKLTATMKGLNNYYISRQTFLPQGYGIACSSGSPFKDVFSRIILRLTEAGLVYRWAEDEVKKVAKNNSPGEAGPKAVNLHQLQAAFFILVMGFAISAMVFGGEIIASRLQQNKTTTPIEKIESRSGWHPPHLRAAYTNSSIIDKIVPVVRKK
nr:glutamate receptor ionotropic, delta-1-like [Procambarus clarkii]